MFWMVRSSSGLALFGGSIVLNTLCDQVIPLGIGLGCRPEGVCSGTLEIWQ